MSRCFAAKMGWKPRVMSCYQGPLQLNIKPWPITRRDGRLCDMAASDINTPGPFRSDAICEPRPSQPSAPSVRLAAGSADWLGPSKSKSKGPSRIFTRDIIPHPRHVGKTCILGLELRSQMHLSMVCTVVSRAPPTDSRPLSDRVGRDDDGTRSAAVQPLGTGRAGRSVLH